MVMDLRSLRIKQAIVHDVPRRLVKGGGGQITYSLAAVSPDTDLSTFLRERIFGSLQSAGY